MSFFEENFISIWSFRILPEARQIEERSSCESAGGSIS